MAPAAKVTQAVFTFAWHLARCQGTAARLLLGIPAPCVELIAQRTLRQVRDLAEAHPEWLKPRWQAQPQVWRDLLRAAADGEPRALQRARLRGQTLLAAEARHTAASGRREPCAARRALSAGLPLPAKPWRCRRIQRAGAPRARFRPRRAEPCVLRQSSVRF